MPRPPERNAKSYDDVVRETVVDPDSSQRPSRDQERQAREGFRALDADEAALQTRVAAALSAIGGVTVEVTRDLVTLRGRVANVADLRAAEDAAARVPGVETIHNQIVVGA